MIDFFEGLTVVEWLLVAGLMLAYVLLVLGVIVFAEPGPALGPEERGGRHRSPDQRPATLADVPPARPTWLGGDESQGWWIWADGQQAPRRH